MQATLTELHRHTAEILGSVIHGQQEVIITEFGRPCAKIVPIIPTITVTEEEFRKCHFTDKAILDAIAEFRQ